MTIGPTLQRSNTVRRGSGAVVRVSALGSRPVGWLLTGVALSAFCWGCSDTRYTFFDEEGGQGGSGSTCSTPDCDPGTQGSGGETTATNPCENPEDPSSPPVRMELVKSGLCFALGQAFTLVSDPAYLISLVPCD